MFSAQNGIFLQIEKGFYLSILCVVSEKGRKKQLPLKKTLIFASLTS